MCGGLDLTENLERNSYFTDAKNKKPEVDFAASGLKSVFGSNRLEIGVSVWSRVEPIAIPFEIEVKHITICKNGTIKPSNTLGNLCIPRAEFENKVRELIGSQKYSIAQAAKELGVAITTVRRVCRTFKIGNYSETNEGIVSRSSQAPFGWDIIQGRLVQNEIEWKWIQKIHELRKHGTSINKIADYLISEKVSTKNGGRWFAKTVSQILKYNRSHLDRP